MRIKPIYHWLKPDKQKVVAFLFISTLVPFYIPICSSMGNCYWWFPFLVTFTFLADMYLSFAQNTGIFGFSLGLIVYTQMFLISYLLGCVLVWGINKYQKNQPSKLTSEDYEVLRKYQFDEMN